MREGVRLVAPDGGWGWMVVLGFSLNNFFAIPILQNFGLVYRDVFKSVDFSVRDVSIIINTNSAFGYILGVLNGPILRNLGFRKTAMIGGVMMFVGLIVTSCAHDFFVFFFFYGLLNSLGIGWTMASFHLALSTYFVKRRGMAMGIAMTVTGLGPVIMPLLIAYLMSVFGGRGTVLLLSGFVLHSVLGGLLLQPVKWHRKSVPIEEANGTDNVNEEEKAMLNKHSDADGRGEQLNSSSVETTKAVNGDKKEIEMKDFTSSKDQKENFMEIAVDGDNVNKEVTSSGKNNEGCCGRIVRMFDLDLLKDPAFLSMLVGMGIALASDMSFSLLLPLILGDYDFDTQTTANLQAVVGAADILSRFLTPFITRKTTLSARVAYLISLIGLILSRFCLTLTSQLYWVAAVVFFFGMSKGVRAVFMPLVIPNYVPLDKLPSALGLQNVMNGIFLMLLGPLIGYVRDKTGNYTLCIHIMNSLTTVTILLWTIEFVYMRSKKKNTFADVADDTR